MLWGANQWPVGANLEIDAPTGARHTASVAFASTTQKEIEECDCIPVAHSPLPLIGLSSLICAVQELWECMKAGKESCDQLEVQLRTCMARRKLRAVRDGESVVGTN